MPIYEKHDYPLVDVRRYLEPGPVVLLSSAHNGETDIMTMGWHMMMEFTPALVGCIISPANHSHELVRASGECVINVPTLELANQMVDIGNSTGTRIDKFKEFGLTPQKGTVVSAPMIGECFASFECKLANGKMIDEMGFFVWKVIKAHVDKTVTAPKTLHYRGGGEFMVAGDSLDLSARFKPEML
ncbi:flavin reductase family protein [Thalassospira mesophila]|uniref:Flavin reductase n=1 Tax=Thalassospira mesophila TaxID=1293891 RepID=A0A1Y2L642_9PROT|nr:flavin reductase family protein [Thalassospira mesophila]OSQ40319.1 flavin reductase [Thalassospira mesophila]